MVDLEALFRPASVAVVGATDREGSVGRAIFENLAGFGGDVVAVNPNRETVLGRVCYPSLAAAPPVELAVIAIPAEAAVEAVREAAETGVEAVVVITAGFAETGAAGLNRERALAAVAAEHDLALVGPNSLGIASTPVGLDATFGPAAVPPGSVSLVSQSGAFVTAAVARARTRGFGFRDVVSLGNAVCLDETDLLARWADDPGTDAVIAYLEGIDRGRAFVETARRVAAETPVAVLKAGRSDAGSRAAASHTGSLAGSDRAYEAAFGQAGVLRAESADELFDAAAALSGLPELGGTGVAVVTNAGGPGVLAADAIDDAALELAEFTDGTVERYRELLPTRATAHNPVDVIGDADAERIASALEIGLGDPNVGAGLVVAAPTAVLSFDALAAAVASVSQRADCPIVACLMTDADARELTAAGIPSFFDPARAVRSLNILARARSPGRVPDPPAFDVDRRRAATILEQAADRPGNRLGVEAMGLLEAYGIPTPEAALVSTPAEAAAAADRIGGPVAMKAVSPEIVHKSDVGAVRTGIAPDRAAEVYEALVTRVRTHRPSATLLGVQVQEQLDLTDRTETIVGTTRDPQFGQLVVFGLGGIFVEVLEDTTLRVGPIDRDEAREMLAEIRAAPLLRGARGRPPADEAALVEAICRLSRLVEDFPEIAELDINPLVAGPDGVQAIDLRLTVDPEHT